MTLGMYFLIAIMPSFTIIAKFFLMHIRLIVFLNPLGAN